MADPPDDEVTDRVAGTSVALTAEGKLRAFATASGNPLWTQSPDAICRRLILAFHKIFAGCGDKLIAFSLSSGAAMVVDKGPNLLDPVVGPGFIVSPHEDGTMNIYDGSRRLRSSKAIPELRHAFRAFVTVPAAAPGRICVLGLVASVWTYRLGCYDDRLTRVWTVNIRPQTPNRPFDLRQLGPGLLVLDDQTSPVPTGRRTGSGHGVLVRWLDGQVMPFDDGTFGVIEDLAGGPLRLDSEILSTGRLSIAAPPEDKSATIVETADVSFALIKDGKGFLAGVARQTGHVMFQVPVSLGEKWDLEVVDRSPVVRTRFEDHWAVTVHDPLTGAVIYRDSRPLARRPQGG